MSTFAGFDLNRAYMGTPFVWGSIQTADGLAFVSEGLPFVVTSQPPTTKYTYDSMSRLTNVKYGTGESVSYTYDSLGNRINTTYST